ncbi:uncharacterized protein CDAR_113871 [Caerostris darwini]|uniref:Uncharacterized protein n=1 Tax=Caerostris darwini TaxID=1538125 RepID=A0AAV4VF95_9ARAC|nr:uncharacterized protein CDAR_113871 [Caerostris darwini]
MSKKISPDSLYQLNIEKTATYLLEKYWNREDTNPFSQVNCYIVNDLFQFLVHKLYIVTPIPLELLLKSGQLQDLDLYEVVFTVEQWKSLMTVLLEEGDSCRNITSIVLPESFQNDENSSLERLIEKCPSLEILDVSTFFSLSALKNCVRLKYVRNHFSGITEYMYFWNETVDTLANLQNLAKFDIFHCRNSASYYTLIAKMLQNHPKLVSLGNTDSSLAAHDIYTTCRIDTVPRFGLKECFWGFNRNVEKFDRKQIAYTQQYPQIIKSSVILFPLLEKLRILVYHEDCIEHLKKLKHLRVLEIDLRLCCSSSAHTAFISLLSEIGPQLKRLSIVSYSTIPVDVVMKYCSNVVHLDLCCSAIVQGGIETDSNNFRQLEKITVREVDKEALEYFLRNSLKMNEVLHVPAPCWDDTLLDKIRKCVNLEIVDFETVIADMTTVEKELKQYIRATFSHIEKYLIGI